MMSSVFLCLRDKPMRLPQLVARTEEDRDLLEEECATLVRRGDLIRDEEAFYSIPPERTELCLLD